MMYKGGINLASQEFPNWEEVEKEFQDFLELINEATNEWEIQIGPWVFKMGTLREYEYREIYRRLSQYDDLTKARLIPLEILTSAIISVRGPNGERIYNDATRKVVLRDFLLTLSPTIIETLYKAYQIGEALAKQKFEEKYKEALEKIRRGDFLG